jgi:AcrR family transcriptional regulator
MPAPERTSLDAIVIAARDLLESAGLASLTMQAVAERVGVRAPSLYKRVRNRDELVALVADATLRELGESIDRVASGDPRVALDRAARAVRAFAHERPAAFRLVFAPGHDVRLDPEALARSSATVLRIAAGLAGEARALDAARTITAWVNGFASMELAGAFRLGGDVDAAFEYGLGRVVAAIADD